jgi:tetratricopeptide (TPR) repeat protein
MRQLRMPETEVIGVAQLDRTEADAWLSEEFANLVSVVSVAAEGKFAEVSWLIVDTLRLYMRSHCYTPAWLHMATASLRAARAADNRAAEASMLLSIGTYHTRQDSEAAMKFFRLSAAIYRALEDPIAEYAVLNDLSGIEYTRGNLRATVDVHEAGVELARMMWQPRSLSVKLGNLIELYAYQGRFAQAHAAAEECLAIVTEHQWSWGKASALDNVSLLYRLEGDYDAAENAIDEALELCAEVGAEFGRMALTDRKAWLYMYRDELTRARELAHEAYLIARDVNSTEYLAKVQNTLGLVHTLAGDHPAARSFYESAVETAIRAGHAITELVSCVGLGVVVIDAAQSAGYAQRAYDLCGLTGSPVWEHYAKSMLETGQLGPVLTLTEATR